jgi:hypothetical protein
MNWKGTGLDCITRKENNYFIFSKYILIEECMSFRLPSGGDDPQT